MRTRGFEFVSSYAGTASNLPQRQTRGSAGYDLRAAETVAIAPGTIAVVSTGLKAYMLGDEYLGIHIRSSLAIKQGLSLINSQGIIDSDYYNNTDNEGHIRVAIINNGHQPVQIELGQRFAQAIFYKYLVADDDTTEVKRQGGIGSTDW